MQQKKLYFLKGKLKQRIKKSVILSETLKYEKWKIPRINEMKWKKKY